MGLLLASSRATEGHYKDQRPTVWGRRVPLHQEPAALSLGVVPGPGMD